MMRTYATGELNRWQFWNYKTKSKQHKQDVQKLMNKAKIPKNLLFYDANEWCPIVQTYYDQLYGTGKYKIFIFRDIGFKTIYQSDVRHYQYPILLYHHNNHFDGIRYIAKFFSSKYYCLSCQSTYTTHHFTRQNANSDVSTAQELAQNSHANLSQITKEIVIRAKKYLKTVTVMSTIYSIIFVTNQSSVKNVE